MALPKSPSGPWQSTIQDFAQPFEKSHPNIKIKVSNVGANEDEYMQLTNALSAGRGIPDLVYLDFNAVHQFAISDQLRNVETIMAGTISRAISPRRPSAMSP